MKAILVIDLPSSCVECPLCSDGQCDAMGIYLEDVFNQKHECCPLKPLPPHEKALMFGSEFETFSEKVGEIVLNAIEENDETDTAKVETD